MIHPCTELRHVSPEIGVGVFATALSPKGTLVYVKDSILPDNPIDNKRLPGPSFNDILPLEEAVGLADGHWIDTQLGRERPR